MMKIIRFIKKKWLILLFIIVFAVLYIGCDRVLSIKSTHGIRQARDMYAQPADTIDVVFMGSSHIHCNVNTALLWEDYGIAAYDYSAAEQPLWTTYYYLKEICKYQDPKLIVLDLYSPARFKADYQYDWLMYNLNGVRFSLNKLQMIYAGCEPERIWDYFPSIATYHLRFKELTEEDWDYLFMSRKERAAFKGYTPYYVVRAQEEPELLETMSGGITVKSEIYLQRIIEYTRENGIDLFLMVSPYITTDEDELVYNRVHEIADRYGLQFNSTNYYYTTMDLQFETDFNDESHLNYLGSCKFTDYLGKELKAMYDLPDRRGDAKWESWDRHVEKINQEVIETVAEQQAIWEEISGSGSRSEEGGQ
ncbi:MAG: hypothetical protein J6P87_09250 [Lachnospiraceae bacterium]|nr:hypothetical protein [Lachnospiraceae bacterium]